MPEPVSDAGKSRTRTAEAAHAATFSFAVDIARQRQRLILAALLAGGMRTRAEARGLDLRLLALAALIEAGRVELQLLDCVERRRARLTEASAAPTAFINPPARHLDLRPAWALDRRCHVSAFGQTDAPGIGGQAFDELEPSVPDELAAGAFFHEAGRGADDDAIGPDDEAIGPEDDDDATGRDDDATGCTGAGSASSIRRRECSRANAKSGSFS